MTKRRYHTCIDVLGGIKNPKAFCGCITVAGKELNTISEVKRLKVAGIGQADVKIAYLKVLMNAYNMRIKNEQLYLNAVQKMRI